jgi:inorganic pyrophosphatase
MKVTKIDPLKGKTVSVIVETPRKSQHKYAFDKKLKVFKLKKTLPLGTVFPFDFGFIPNTVGGDGDPLDVLILMDEPAYPGCLVECRLIGALVAKQKEASKESRNDRIIAVSQCCILFEGVKKVQALSKNLTTEIEEFFKDYNKREGREFIPIKFAGPKYAIKLVEKASKKRGQSSSRKVEKNPVAHLKVV